MRTTALAAFVLVLLAGGARAEEPAGLDAALKAFEAADWKAAVAAAEAVAEDSPDAAKARYLAGEAHLVLGEAEPAEKAFRFVLGKNAKALPAQVGLGRSLTALGRVEEAKDVLEKAVAADPKDVASQRALGELLVRTGELEKAEKTLEAAWKAAPNDPLTARALVEARLRKDDLREAHKIADRLIKALPKHPMGPFLKALVLEKDGKDEEAIEAYEKAIALDDKFIDAHKDLAILCHTRNPTYQDAVRTKKAMEHYERYFALGGSDVKLREMYDTLKAFFDSQK